MRQLKISKSITNRESASLEKYLSDIGKEPMINAEEEVRLARLIKEGDESALEQTYPGQPSLCRIRCQTISESGTLSTCNLVNQGNLGLIKAAKRFDETRGFKFISYAVVVDPAKYFASDCRTKPDCPVAVKSGRFT